MEPGRRPLVLVALAAFALAGAIVWLAPASLLDSRIARATEGVVRLASAQGTLWNGRGVLAAANAQIPVAWSLDPWPLVHGVVRLYVRSDAGTDSPRGTIELRTDEVGLQDTDVTVPAAAIGALLGDMTAGLVDGDVNASTSNLRLAPTANRGEARLTWRNARIRGIGSTMPLELGEVRTALVANGAAMSGLVDNAGGSLGVRGEWALKEKDAFTLALLLTPRNSGDAELVRWLSAVGTPEGESWRLHWRLPLR